MDPEKMNESKQLAGKLYQAVLSLKPGEYSTEHHVHRMAQALALAKAMQSRTPAPAGSARTS
jgi:hypothetical protein